MDTIDWRFSQDLSGGTRIVSVGFDGCGRGLGLAPLVQYAQSDIEIGSADGYTWERDLAAVAPETVSGLFVVHAAFSLPPAPSVTSPTIPMTYGGLALEVDTEILQESAGHNIVQAMGYVYIRDGRYLEDDTLEIDLSALGYAGADTVLVALSVVWWEGVEEASPAFLNAGTLDTFTSPLELDPGPSVTYQMVMTGAVQAREIAGSSNLQLDNENYVLATESVSNDDAYANWGYYACDTSFNCDCEVDPAAETLEELRVKLLTATGYAAQAANPPPGIASMYNGFLDTAQKFLFKKARLQNSERFFSWQLIPGIRYYGLYDNINCCSVLLDRYKISGAWIQDLNNTWWPLVRGIDPTFYTLTQNFGWPNFFEIRQCIEVFPAPQAAYKLWIRGQFGLQAFTADSDTTTIPADPVLNYAKFLAKSHKGMKDADIYRAMAFEEMGYYVAALHNGRRYIPGTRDVPVPTPPIMTHFES